MWLSVGLLTNAIFKVSQKTGKLVRNHRQDLRILIGWCDSAFWTLWGRYNQRSVRKQAHGNDASESLASSDFLLTFQAQDEHEIRCGGSAALAYRRVGDVAIKPRQSVM
jgi:hypothetical protein